jgi:hypothetical protein
MQVDRQPSPWPCVALLIGLVLLCLMAPRYWRSQTDPGATERLAEPVRSESRSGPGFTWSGDSLSMPFGMLPGGCSAEHDPLQLWAPPTLEELIASRAGVHRHQEPPFGWPVIAQASPARKSESVDVPAPPPAVPGPVMKANFARAGQLLANHSLLEALPRVSATLAELYGLWSSQQVVAAHAPAPGLATSSFKTREGEAPAEPNAGAQTAQQELRPPRSGFGTSSNTVREVTPPAPSTLRLVSPQDRLAMHTPQVKRLPAHQEPVPESPKVEPPAPPEIDPWCVPQVLFDQLERLANHPVSAAWAERTIAQLRQLTNRDHLDGDDVHLVLGALSNSAQAAAQLAEATAEDRLRVELLRAHWALARRLDCWAVIHDIRVAERIGTRFALHGSAESFVNGPRTRAAERVQNVTLSVDLEEYERSRDPQLGRHVVRQQQALRSSHDSLDRALAESVEQNYRNANVRIALTAELLNRLVGEERSEVRMLRDYIAGAPVQGRSQLRSESWVRLEPAEGLWQLSVQARGSVNSQTSADGGPAQLRSHSLTDFAARKTILVDSGGVCTQPATIEATNHNRLVGVTTDFDWVPIVGSLARDRAVSQYHARRGQARAEVERKVSTQAVEQLDRETLDAVERIERQVRQRLTDRLAEAGIDLTPIQMTTTRQRMVGRFRVAGDDQLGSHTPRPRALSDSLASVQVHETALTNVAVTLSLDGRRYTAPELQQLFREKFPRMATNGEVAEQDTVFHFAAKDAVKFRFEQGRMELALSLAAVEQDGRTMHDVIVHAFYVPIVSGLEAELARDGTLGIEGRLSSGDRARMHNVFNSVLAPERRLPILRLEQPSDPRLEGLMITQLVLEDGWLGLAIGPLQSQRVAERSRSLR